MNILLSGAIASGRTAFAGRLVEQFLRHYLLTGGFLCPSRVEDGGKTDYAIVDLLNGRERPFGALKTPANVPEPGDVVTGRWTLYAKGFAFGAQAVERAMTLKTPILFLDEIGPLELEGGGFRWLVDLLIRGPLKPPVFIGVVREEIVSQVQGLYPDQAFDIVRTDGKSAAEVVVDIRRSMRMLGTQLRELR